MVARFLDRTDAQLLAWTLLTKVAVLVIGYTALSAAIGGTPGFLDPWHRWDAPHYTDIAVFGYRAEDPGNLSAPGYSQVFPGDLDLYIVFFPLFPWLIAAVNAVVGEPIVSAFVVATVASLFVAPLLYRLVSVDLGHRIGLWTAGFLLVFPTAYFLHIGYTESLFLSLAFGSMWLARTNRWWLAGLLAALAALTRINGLILAPALRRRGVPAMARGPRPAAARRVAGDRRRRHRLRDLPPRQPGRLRRPVRLQRDPARRTGTRT